MPSLLSTLWLPSQMDKQTIYEVMGLNEIEDPVTDLNLFVPFQQVRVRLKKYMSKAEANKVLLLCSNQSHVHSNIQLYGCVRFFCRSKMQQQFFETG